jgi:glutamate/tyrosine decarboxylase-like PLP-dependent enzyme
VHPASVSADALVAAYNPQLAAWSHAPAANVIERFTLDFLVRRLGGDPETSFACFASGGAEANHTAVLVALTRAFPGFGETGLAGLGLRPAIYLSAESHHSFQKIAHATGLGRSALRTVPVDRGLRLDVKALGKRMAADRGAGFTPALVVATAGTTGAGAIDPLPELADLCRARELWLHVDAAWGGAACLSPRLAPLLAGIERADSITWDAHKWLSVPMGAGMFFCRHRKAVEETFAVQTGYMPPRSEEAVDPYRTTLQWSRRFIGLKLFMALAEKGETGFREAIESQTERGDELRTGLERAGFEVVSRTPLPLVCFTHEALREGRLSVEEAVARTQARGFWISEVRLAGHAPMLRACITSFRTTTEDIDALVRALREIIVRETDQG